VDSQAKTWKNDVMQNIPERLAKGQDHMKKVEDAAIDL